MKRRNKKPKITDNAALRIFLLAGFCWRKEWDGEIMFEIIIKKNNNEIFTRRIKCP